MSRNKSETPWLVVQITSAFEQEDENGDCEVGTIIMSHHSSKRKAMAACATRRAKVPGEYMVFHESEITTVEETIGDPEKLIMLHTLPMPSTACH